MKGRPDLTLAPAATKEGLEAAAKVLAPSFQATSNFAAAFPDAGARGRALPHVFRLVVRDAAAFGEVVLATLGGEVVGAAVWYPPGQGTLTLGRQLRAVPHLARTFGAAPQSFARFARLGGALEQRKPKEPHRYLAALGVTPARQGRGVGSALLAAGLARADARGQTCYLETFSEANRRLYAPHGFTVVRRGDDLIPGGPTFWFMTRPPGGVSGLRDELEL